MVFTDKPVTQCNRTQSPARFSRKRPQCRRWAEISGTADRINIKFGTRRLFAATGGLPSDIVGKISRARTGWLAQQCRWPPALPVFPANREFYREFCKIVPSGAPETLNSGAVAGLPMQFPCATEQGIISTEQGILSQEQRILSFGIEIIAG
jgi:hypothetical protein